MDGNAKLKCAMPVSRLYVQWYDANKTMGVTCASMDACGVKAATYTMFHADGERYEYTACRKHAKKHVAFVHEAKRTGAWY